jgi:transposase
MTGASIETTLELWASSLRDVKVRMRGLFTHERGAASAKLFLDGLLGEECRKTGWMSAVSPCGTDAVDCVRQKSMAPKSGAEQVVRDIRWLTRKHYSAEEKIRIVLSGLRGEDSIAELCWRNGIAESLSYSWFEEFLEAGKKRLSGDTARQVSTGGVKDLRRERRELNEVVAEE